ncbi:hypothetical protein KCP78_25030 [Salmonella enterica subsp. enterica]|nr:hypothetical protein KCP78_25030 [Salmonella enterica subsp. enterica]
MGRIDGQVAHAVGHTGDGGIVVSVKRRAGGGKSATWIRITGCAGLQPGGTIAIPGIVRPAGCRIRNSRRWYRSKTLAR